MTRFVEKMGAPEQGAPLGRVTFVHVHDDDSEHEARFTPPSGTWGGEYGTIPAGASVECLDCGAIERG